MKKFLSLLTLIGFPFGVTAGEGVYLDPPKPAPLLQATNQNGESVHLEQLYKASPYVAVFFYPKADTPGCTKQACSIRDQYADLQKSGISVIGVSADNVESQKAFALKYSFPYPLLADPDAKIIDAFGVGKIGKNYATRQAFLIKEGKIVWHDEKASTSNQADDLLKVVDKLTK